MGSLLKGVGKAVKKVAKPEIIIPLALIAATGGAAAPAVGAKGATAAGASGGLGGLFSSIFGGGAGAAGSGGLGSFLTSKKFLLPQLISAGTQLATTGKIDPKQQLLAAALSGVGSLGQGATAAEKAALAQRTAGMSAAEAAKLQAGYAGMSRDAAQALASGANPFGSAASQITDPGLLRAMTGSAAGVANTAGTMSALPAINPTLAAQANPAAFQTFLESAPLSQRLGQTAANLTRGLGQGLANPLSKKGLMSYGALGTAGMILNEMGKPQTEAQKNLGVDAQAQYDLAREMNRMMGGAYTDEQLNTITAPMLSQYGGEYETITNPFQRRRRPMFPGLNYSGLTRYAADGGSIKPKKRKEAIEEMEKEIEQRDIITDALFGGTTPGMNEDAIAEQMFDMMRREELNPTGRAMGGSVPQTERIPNGMQIDGRGGGFIPMGAKERKDDVPAMLAKNEFVMTADAVRGAGDGNVNVGAQRMYDLMNNLESKV